MLEGERGRFVRGTLTEKMAYFYMSHFAAAIRRMNVWHCRLKNNWWGFFVTCG
jgi:hypothetical protein